MAQSRRSNPVQNPEDRELQLTAAAMNLAEKQLLEGSASATVIVHFLKLGSQRAQLEAEQLRHQTMLLEARSDEIHGRQGQAELLDRALKAFTQYSGRDEEL